MKIVITCQPVDAEFFRQKDQKNIGTNRVPGSQ
jgi:hypothetical protein